MMNSNILLLSIGLLLSPGLAFFARGQADTSLVLDDIIVRSSILKPAIEGSEVVSLWPNDQIPNQNLSEILNTNSNAYIKSFGPGSVATLALRGSNANHTAVIWNGFPIQSPLLGLIDLSLIPSLAGSEISLVKGGGSSAWGSGAIAGSIEFNQPTNYSGIRSIEILGSVGSFNTFKTQIATTVSNKNVYSRTAVQLVNAANEFSYSIGPRFPTQQLSNAGYDRMHLFQDIGFKINEDQELKLNYWYLNADTEIPPTLTQTTSAAVQMDNAHRASLSWNVRKGNVHYDSRVAFYNEQQNFQDETFLIDAQNDFRTMIAEVNTKYFIGNNYILRLGANHIFNKRLASQSQEENQESRSSVTSSIHGSFDALSFQLSTRLTRVSEDEIPFVPALGFKYQLGNNIGLRGKVSRNFRAPTLNDKYWNPGGNENLLSESGWSEELGVDFDYSFSKQSIGLSLTGFNRKISDWILWIPQDGFIWSPQNINEVWSRGFESSVSLIQKFGDTELQFRGQYDYIRSTNEVALTLPMLEKGSQLIYVPEHKANLDLQFRTNSFSAEIQHSIVSSVTGINESVPAYHLSNFYIKKQVNISDWKFAIFLNSNNIFDQDYIVTERRPMPGRNFELGVQLSFEK